MNYSREILQKKLDFLQIDLQRHLYTHHAYWNNQEWGEYDKKTMEIREVIRNIKDLVSALEKIEKNEFFVNHCIWN